MIRHHPLSASAKIQKSFLGLDPESVSRGREHKTVEDFNEIHSSETPKYLNVHSFDGHLDKVMKCMNPKIKRASKINYHIKMNAFRNLRDITSHTFSETAMKYLDMIIETFSIHKRTKSPTNGNYDSQNNLFACDMLYLLSEKYSESFYNIDFLNLLNDILEEMRTGSCPQGRTTRLFQLLLMLDDEIDFI
jgi:hypothetical protein